MSLMSPDQSSDMASMLSRRTPGAPHHCHNSRGKNLHHTRTTIKSLVRPSPARTMSNLRVSPRICGSYAIHRRA